MSRKRKRRKSAVARFQKHLNAKIERIRDNGNPRKAAEMVRFWTDISQKSGCYSFHVDRGA